MAHDIVNIAIGMVIAQMVRPLIIATMWIARDKLNGTYYRVPDRSFMSDFVSRVQALY